MNEILVIVLFLLWYIGALIVSENTPKEGKIGREWMFFFSMIFSPFIGLVAKLLLQKK